MKLMTKELEEKFKKYPIGSQDNLGGKAKIVTKYFNPTGVGTWLITEGNKLDNGDYELFGYCHLGDDDLAEFGYVMLSDLENIKLPFGLKIERDLYLDENCNLIDAMKSSGITPPDFLLENKIEKNKFEEEPYFDMLVNDIKLMDDDKSYTVARVCNGVNSVELHYNDGLATIEYGTRIADDEWESEVEGASWFDKNMNEKDLQNKLWDLFEENYGKEDDYEL